MGVPLPAPSLSSLRLRARRLSCLGLAAVLVGGTLALLVPAPAHAAESLAVSKDSAASVLVGDEVAVSLSATNNGDQPEYNLSFRDRLPAGVTYVPGSTRPTSIGEPTVVTGGAPERQTLLWRNVSDLPVTASQGLSFRVQADPDAYPVGSSFENVGEAYASSDPRTLPTFDGDGVYTTGASVQGASGAARTSISAIQVRKTEPSSEHELRRGVHDHSTPYTLTVVNNGQFADDDVVLVDLIPAGLEFLGCGLEDNTPGGGVEYPGAPRLDVATPDVTPCVAPVSVETVTDPADVPAGVYTRVQWDLGTLGPGDVATVVYRAGVPQRANTATFPGGAPAPASGGQAANLANNTGPATREIGELALTNRASVTAEYAGPTAPDTGRTVSDTDELTVTAEDLAVQKSVTPGVFAQGGVATYTLDLQTGEYADASGIVLTDVLPNGLCPLDDTANHAAGSPAECAPGAGFAPSTPFDTVVENADGSFTVTFDPIDLAASGETTVTYQARMLSSYRGGETPPTATGDGFTNTVSLTGSTTTLADVDAPGGVTTETVEDHSSASIASETLVLDKLLQPAGGPSPYTCASDPAAYKDSATMTPAQATFREGDRVCFALRVDFPEGTDTRNAVLADFLPSDLTYESASLQPLTGNDVAVAVDESALTLTLGDLRPGAGDDLFVEPGSTLLYRISGIVGDPPPVEPQVTGNLAKLTWQDTAGNVSFLRDREDFTVAPAPVLGVVKSADRVTATAPGATGPLRDADDIPDGDPAPGPAEWVRIGDVVDFTVAVTNEGVAENRNDVSTVAPDVWDVLPAGIACAHVSSISDAGVCTDPDDLGHPTFAQRETRSAVRWGRPDTVSIAHGATLALTYRVTYPTTVSPDTTYRNDAAVASYRAGTNLGGLSEHYPADNVDTTVVPEDEDAPEAADSHTLLTPSSRVTKTNETEIDDAGQGTSGSLNYAVVGETVTYTVEATLPANTTVYAGLLTDTAPSGVRVDSVAFSHRAAPTDAWGPLPAGFTATSPTARITFPAELAIGTADDQVRMVVTATVLDADANVHGRRARNTARLTSTTAAGAPATNRAAISDVYVAEPSPAPLKGADDTTPTAGQEVTYTVTARNVAPGATSQLRPVLHDAVLVDCVPDGLAVQPTPSVSSGTVTVEAPGTQGCAAGTTPLRWDVGDLAWRSPAAAAGAQPWPTLTYVVEVDPAAAGGQQYTNVASLSGSSRSGADPDERAYSGDVSRQVVVPGAALSKSVAEATEPVGGTSTYTLEVDLPQDVNFYEATVVDELPAGIDPATVAWVSSSCAYTDGPAGACGVAAASDSALAPSGRRHGFFLGDVAADPRPRRVTVTYTAVVGVVAGNTAGTVLTNRANLAWNQTDSAGTPAVADTFDATSDADSASVTVTEPSLTVDKTVDVAEPTPGQTFTYTLRVTNASGANRSTAHDVDVVDTLPAGVQVVGTPGNGGVAAGGSPAGGTVTWTDLGPVAPGAAVTLTYTARLATPAPKTDQVNTADITGYTSLAAADGGGRTYDGPTDQATVSPALPVLQVDKTVAGSSPAYLDEAFGWRIEVENTGSATAFDVDVEDVLPSDWDYDADSARVSVAGAPATSVEPSTAGSPVQTLTWDDLGDLAVGEKLVVTFDAVPAATLAPTRVGSDVAHVNDASATAQDLDGDAGSVITDDADTARTRIDEADLSIDKKAVGTPVAGERFSWTLTVANDGADVAAGPFEVTDDLPAGVTGATGSGTGWSCSSAAGTVTCERTSPSDTLASGASFQDITITASVPDDVEADTDLANSGSVSARTYDPVAANDSDDVTVATRTVSDMGVVKRLVGDLTPGTRATYAITVTNHGPSVARGAITVTDTLPSGLTYRSFEGTGWTLDRTGQDLELTWTGATPVAVGAMPQITVVADVDSSVTGDVVNTAAVTEPTDPTAGKEADDSSTVTTTPSPSADLRLDKSSPGEFRAGTRDSYRLDVRNLGPSDAAGPLTVTDTLPDGVTYDSVTSTDAWSCSAAGQDVTCTLAGGLDDEATTRLDLVVDIAAAATGDLENSAIVSSPTADPNSGNDTGTDDTGITVESDLAIDKAVTDAPVVAGERATYTLTVSNNGPASSPGPIVVTDTLASPLTLVSFSGTGWTCTGTRELECTRPGPLAPDAEAPVLILVTEVASDAGASTLANSGNVAGPATDPTTANNTDTVSVTVAEDAELSIGKSVEGSGTVAAGDTVEFTIAVDSAGPSDARDVDVTDTLPDGMSLVSLGGTGWTCDGLACSRDRVAAGTSAPDLTLVARVGSGVRPTTLTNSASVSTATPGDDTSDNTDTADVTTVVSADLSLVKSHGTGTAVAGESTSFDLVVSNEGPSDNAGPITVTDTLPDQMSYLSANAPWSCVAGKALECTLTGGLTAGATAPTLTVQVQVAEGAPAGDVTNTASVGSDDPDPVAKNDTDTAGVEVTRLAELSVTKSHEGPVRIGDDLSFEIIVSNAGPSDARGVVLTDPLAEGLTFVSADGGEDWSCAAAGEGVRCTYGKPLPAEADAPAVTVVATVGAEAYPSVDNIATVSADTPEASTADNASTDTVEVPPQVDLGVAKSATRRLVVGEETTYELEVTNQGPTEAPGTVTVTDTLPTGLRAVAAEGDGWSCALADPTVTCEREPTLGVDESTVLRVVVEVLPEAYPSVTNTAVVSGASEDTNEENDATQLTSTVAPTVDLSIEKSVAASGPGGVLYQLTVTNGGPSATVKPVRVRDPLPSSLRFYSVEGKGWSCSTSPRLVSCAYAGTLEAGESASIMLTTRIVAKPGTRIRNVASASGGGATGTWTDDATLTAQADGDPGDGDSGGGDPAADESSLPDTGGPSAWLWLLAALLVLGGLRLLLRRRTTA